MKVLIVGGGLGGLCTSIALTLSGHTCTIIDSAPEFVEAGAGIRLPPNNTKLLLRWGIDLDSMKKSTSQGYNFVRWQDGSSIAKVGFDEIEGEHGGPYYLVHRADFHDALLKRARELGVEIVTNQQIASYDFERPSATTTAGRVWAADLVVCADGVKSTARSLLTGQPDLPRDTGDTAYRIVLPGKELLADPILSSLITSPATTSWCGPTTHIVGYPIRSGQLYNIVVCATSSGSETSDDVWVVKGSNQELCEKFKDWEPRIQRICAMTQEFMKWRLCDLPELSTWIHPGGKACLLGDACHPMLPYLAQGAAQAAEDAAVLSQCLTEQRNLHESLRRYERIRKPRAELIMAKTREHQYILHVDDGKMQKERDAKMKIDGKENPVFWGHGERRKWLFGYDAEDIGQILP